MSRGSSVSKKEKFLIHFPENKIAPKGGPAGYLNNLRLGLEENDEEEFSFLPAAKETYEQNKTLQNLVPSRIKELRRLHNLLALPSKNSLAAVDYSRYSAIHFHSTEDMYLCRKALESYNGKVVLTSHSPCAYHKELISRLNPKDVSRKAKELSGLEAIDRYAFERADGIIFPCKEAEEPYFHTWKNYDKVRDEQKIRYVPTGIISAVTQVSRHAVRRKYGIPDDAFVVCYVGRHNEIKGYDALKSAATGLLAQDDVWFLVAGREGPLFGCDHPRWIEVGWTDDPHSLMAASDVFVLPNRETYFDLIMLEALSLGQIIIASRTGGNRYFERFNSPGIFLYDEPTEINKLVQQIKKSSRSERASWGSANQSIYREEFTVDVFAHRYVSVMGEICGE